jgi:hypothetical protein
MKTQRGQAATPKDKIIDDKIIKSFNSFALNGFAF